MAQLSRTTQIRRDLNAAEESEVVVYDVPPNIRAVGEFAAYIRCFDVQLGQSQPALDDTTVWTGEQDGSLVLRSAMTGEVVKDAEGKEMRILRKPKTFIYCLAHVGDKLWCGLSDGYVRVYNRETAELLFEKRKHIGAVNTIIAAENNIFTGGDDFQILQWDASTMTVTSQLSGSGNHIKALTMCSGYLFSVGDDNIIRRWDLSTCTECAEPFPIMAHKDGIRAMVASSGFVYTGGKDGFVKKFDAITGDFIFEFSPACGAVTSLVVLENSARILVGTSGGSVVVLDAETFEPIGGISDHRNTIVNHLVPLARISANKMWFLGADGTTRVIYTESDSVDPTYNAFPDHHINLQEKIETMRAIIMENDQELGKYRDQLSRLKAMDSVQKEVVRDALRGMSKRILSREYFEKLLTWLSIQRGLRRRRQLGELLMDRSNSGLRDIYFSKLARFAQVSKRRRQRTELAECLLKTTNKGLQSLYLRNCISYINRLDRQRKRRDVGESLLKATSYGLMLSYYAKWRRWQVRVHNQRKRDDIAGALLRNSEKGMLTLYYKKLLDFYDLYQTLKKREMTADALAMNTQRGMMMSAYQRLFKLRRIRRDQRKKRDAGMLLLSSTEYGIRRLCYSKMVANVTEHKKASMEGKNAELLEKIKALRALVEDETILTDDEIDARMERTQTEMDEIHKEMEDYDAQILDLEGKEADLQRLLQKNIKINQDLSLPQQVDEVMRMLKARGVMCGMHLKQVADVRDLEKTQHKKPASTVTTGLARVRNVAREVSGEQIAPGEDWPLQGGAINTFSDRQMKSSLTGIREMTIAWDCLRARGQNPDEVTCMMEIVDNSGWLIDIVLRDWNSRLPPEEASRPVASVVISVPSTEVYTHTSTNVKVRLMDAQGKPTTASGKVEITVPEAGVNSLTSVFGGESFEPVVFEREGTFDLSANYEGITASTSVKVIGAPDVRAKIAKRVSPGTTAVINVEGVDRSGNSIPCFGVIKATCNGEPIPDGKMSNGFGSVAVHVEEGEKTVEVEFAGVKTSASFVVAPPPPVSSLSVSVGKTQLNKPCEVVVTLNNENGDCIEDAEGVISLKHENVTAKTALVKKGVAKLAATPNAPGDHQIEVFFKEQNITTTCVMSVEDPNASSMKAVPPKATPAKKAPSAAPSAKAAKAPAAKTPATKTPGKAAPAKGAPAKAAGKSKPEAPWMGCEVSESCGIKSVVASGPAAAAGVQVDDIVVSVEGTEIASLDDFRSSMKANAAIGKVLTFVLRRGEETQEVQITVGSSADKPKN
eukprot:PhM_4_TR3692/c0_g1_i1/m.47546